MTFSRSRRFHCHSYSSLCSSAMTKPRTKPPKKTLPVTPGHIFILTSIGAAAHHVPLFTTDYLSPRLFRLVAFSKASDCILAPIPSSSYQESNLLAASPAQKPTALTHPTPALVCPQSPDGRRGKGRAGKQRKARQGSLHL